MPSILGIDPGQSGGIALIDDGEAGAWKMPETERDVYNLISDLGQHNPVAYIELVHSMPRQGVASSFKFGVGYGGLRMVLIALEIPFQTVAPGTWQRKMHCMSKGDKNVTKRRAQELFPSLHITHAVADALLIASYGQQITDTLARHDS